MEQKMGIDFADFADDIEDLEVKSPVRSGVRAKNETDYKDRELSDEEEEQLLFTTTINGNPYGSYGEKIEFFQNILLSEKERGVSDLLKIAVKNWGILTTEFLENLGGNGRRISELRYRAGFKAIPMKYYFSEMTNTKFKTNMNNYSVENGKYFITTDVCSVGRFRVRRGCKSYHKWITNKEFRDMNAELEKVSERVAKDIEETEFRAEMTLNNVFCDIDGNEWRSLKELDMSEKQYGAYSRLRDGHSKNHVISELYAYKVDEIKSLMSQFQDGKHYKFPVDKFCELFRKDKAEVNRDLVISKLKQIAKTEGVKREFKYEEGKIVVM